MAEQILEKTTSADGTPIAYWRSGRGPALVLVHGSTADHTRWDRVRPLLEPHHTVLAMDRRGRGASGDGGPYSLGAEAADVVAVVAAATAEQGEPVDVFGHSFGAHCALEAALLTTGIRRLALYEPAIIPVTTPEFTAGLERLLAEGPPRGRAARPVPGSARGAGGTPRAADIRSVLARAGRSRAHSGARVPGRGGLPLRPGAFRRSGPAHAAHGGRGEHSRHGRVHRRPRPRAADGPRRHPGG
ncbi:MAG: alpha/beta fold hydrolase [Pseudonocardia sp.]